jgi:hypothetical protein
MTDDIKREELRGLFTLSLLALLIVIRTNASQFGIQNTLTKFTTPSLPFVIGMNFLGLLDVAIFLWVFYAGLMVLGFSDDLIHSSKIRKDLRTLGLICLVGGPILIGVLFFVTAFSLILGSFYPQSVYVMVILLIALIITWFVFKKYGINVDITKK